VKLGLRTAVAVAFACSSAAGGDPEGAERLYRAGRDAVAKGDWATACEKFRASAALSESDSTSIYLADCDARDGKVADAASTLRELADRLGPKDPLTAEAKKRLAAVDKRVPRLIVRLAASAPEGTKITRDGVELKRGALGEALPVNIGEHAIVVTAPGRKDVVRKVTTAEGKTEQVEVEVGPREDTPPAPAGDSTKGAAERSSTERAGSGNKTLGYVLGGVGVVGIGVAAITGLSLSSKRSAMDAAHCDSTTRVCSGAGLTDGAGASDGVKAASSGASLQPVFYGAAAVGVIGLAAGAYFVLSGDGSSGATAGVRVGPQRLSLEGRF
jgi:hypothetical protein